MRDTKYKFVFFCFILLLYSTDRLYSESWGRPYFTTPENDTEGVNGIRNPEQALIRLIRSGKKSFYGAFYDLSSRSIVSALKDAYKRGMDVRLVIEKDHIERDAIKELKDLGIEVISDNRSGLMHNKFAIIDGEITWTGSYNLTHRGAYMNNNNAIEICSKDLATIYLNEFDEMHKYGIFGNKKEYRPFSRLIKRCNVKVKDIEIYVYFSPEDNVERVILERLRTARTSIHFMAFSFTSDRIGEEMIRLFKSGIKVYGIIEKVGANSRYSEYIKMKLEEIPVKLDKNRYRMHHKVIIIDEESVITGSYNYTDGANKRNDENILIIKDKRIAIDYMKEFCRLYY